MPPGRVPKTRGSQLAPARELLAAGRLFRSRQSRRRCRASRSTAAGSSAHPRTAIDRATVAALGLPEEGLCGDLHLYRQVFVADNWSRPTTVGRVLGHKVGLTSEACNGRSASTSRTPGSSWTLMAVATAGWCGQRAPVAPDRGGDRLPARGDLPGANVDEYDGRAEVFLALEVIDTQYAPQGDHPGRQRRLCAFVLGNTSRCRHGTGVPSN